MATVIIPGSLIIPDNLPVGYRFHPTDEELVDHYLKLKVLGFRDNICIIPEVDICKWEPWELAQRFKEQSIIPSDDKVQEWWFFCPQMPRVQRSTRLGFWKKTGVDRTIKARDNNRVIGTKKTLVFHEGRSPKGIKTNWVVHEYHLLTDNLDELFPHNLTKNYVLCRLKSKGDEKSVISTIQSNGLVISLIDSDSDLHQPEPENSFSPWIQAMGNSPISIDDWDSHLHQPEHEKSLVQRWIQPAGNSPISFVDLDSSLHQPEPENSFSPLIQVMGNSPISIDDWDSHLHQPEHENSLVQRWIQPAGNSPISFVDLDSDLHQPEHENSLSELWNGAVGNSSREPQVITSIFPQTSFQSENVDFQTNFQELINIRSPSFAEFSLDNGDAFIDKSDQLQFDYFDRDQIQTQYGPTCSSENELDLMENRRTQTIESLHGVVPLDEKKGLVENNFNGLHVSSPKHVEPPKKPEIARTYSTDSMVEKVEKLELAARNIKLECVTLDELEAKAKVGECREHSAASNSPQNNHNKGIEPAIEKSNKMSNLGGTITDCTKVSIVPPLYGQKSSSRNDHAARERCLTPTIQPLHRHFTEPKCNVRDSAHGCVDVPLEKKKSFVGTESNCLNVLPLKPMEPLEKPATIRTYSEDEEKWVKKVEKQELAARNIKPDCISLDDSAAKVKHDESSRLHKEYGLGGVARLEGKKSFSENESADGGSSRRNRWEHLKEAVNAGMYGKHEETRLENVKKPEFSAREISSQEGLPLVESTASQIKGESNKHNEETEPAREQSISAITLAGSTANSTEIFAILSIVNLTNMIVFLIFSAISLNLSLRCKRLA